MILTSLFLAAKTENTFIPLDYFKKQLPANIDSSQLTNLEFPLSQGLQFSYTVWSCLRPLWGFGLEIIELVNEGALGIEKEQVRTVLDDARQRGSESLRTEAQFLFTPPQIALACIYYFNPELVRDFLRIKFPSDRTMSPLMERVKKVITGDKLLEVVVECHKLITERLDIINSRTKEDTVKLVTAVDKKLWQCRKALDSLEVSADPVKRKSTSPDAREIKKPKSG